MNITHKSTTKLRHTMAAGVFAGATALGFGALSALAAPAAHADWWFLNDVGSKNGNDLASENLDANNTIIGATNGNGNTEQTASWGNGNIANRQSNVMSPVVGGVAINAGATAAVGGSSIATDVPVAAGNSNNLGGTLGLNPSTALAGNAGGAVGAALGGSNAAANVPVTAPIAAGFGANVPVAALLGGTGGLLGDGPDVKPSAGDATGVGSQNNSGGSSASSSQTGGDAEASASNQQAAGSSASSDGNNTQTNQVAGNTSVSGTAKSGTGGSASANTHTTGTAGGNISENHSNVNNSSNNGNKSNNSVGNGNSNHQSNNEGGTNN